MAVNPDPRYAEYFRLFAGEKFFEAHEVLEALWRETKGETRDFYQGLIQLAAALVHFQRGNLTGAQELFRTASQYLKPYLPDYQGVALREILKDFRDFLGVWSQHLDDPPFVKNRLPKVILNKI